MQMGIFKTAIGGFARNSLIVSGAGTAQANGTYQTTGRLNGENSYTKVGDKTVTAFYDGTRWNISVAGTSYYRATTKSKVNSNTWSNAGLFGSNPPPTVVLK